MTKAFTSNIYAIAKNSPLKHIRKQPYFDRKWGTDAAFNKTVNKEIFANDTRNQKAEILDQILVRFKTTKLEPARKTFLTKMTAESTEFVQEQRAKIAQEKYEEQLCHNAMTKLLEQIFELLKLYSIELNTCLGNGSLYVASTHPQTVNEILKFNQLRQAEQTVSFHRARLSTNSHSLVLRGDKMGIQFFIIPVAKAIGLSKQESHFLPTAKLAAHIEADKVIWFTDNGQRLTPKTVESICMSLFEQLIETSKEDMRKHMAFADCAAS